MPRGRTLSVLALATTIGCGRLGFDELGSGTITPPEGDWRSVAVGESYGCAIASDLSLWCWGENDSFQCAGGEPDLVPLTRVTADTDWESVATGIWHTCAIKTDGTLWCWGENYNGQLGLGSPGGQAMVPTRVGTDTDWAEVGIGGVTTCARKTGGTLWCWGENKYGALGLGVADGMVVAAPAQVGAAIDWTSLATTTDSACAVRGDGTGWCWGEGENGQLGDGTRVAHDTPVQVASIASWTRIVIAEDHACGLTTDQRLRCWGGNWRGQLGIGSTDPELVPTEVIGGGAWTTLALGNVHTCAVRADNTLWCWGDSRRGQAAVEENDPQPVPVQRGSAIQAVTANRHNTCWLGVAGGIQCAGDTSTGQRPGDPPTESAELKPIDSGWSAIAAGRVHACGLRPSGEAECWGATTIGDGTDLPRQRPVSVGTGFTTIAAGGELSLGIKTNGTLWQWGDVPLVGAELAPIQVGAATGWSAITAGHNHACALDNANALWCWGHNTYGQLGDGTTMDRVALTQVAGTWIAVAAGAHHTCAINGASRMFCWGYNEEGQLGNGTSGPGTYQPVPTLVSPSETTWVEVTAGANSSCGRLASGAVWCWGSNGAFQLGNGSGADSELPVTQPIADWTQLFGADEHVCGFRAGMPGQLWCWGHRNELEADFMNPTVVGTFATYGGGDHFGCAVKADGSRWCWGYNREAQYGDGTTWSSTPWTITRP